MLFSIGLRNLKTVKARIVSHMFVLISTVFNDLCVRQRQVEVVRWQTETEKEFLMHVTLADLYRMT